MMPIFGAVSSVTLLLLAGLNEKFVQINSFSPTSLFSTPPSTYSRDISTRLFMSVDKSKDIKPGQVITTRYLHRFAPSKSQTPYTIEERQMYSVAGDRSLMPLGDKTIIFRGDVGEHGKVDINTSNGERVTSIGPALYTIDGLHMGKAGLQKLGDSIWGSSYAMALYCMGHSETIRGRGIEVSR